MRRTNTALTSAMLACLLLLAQPGQSQAQSMEDKKKAKLAEPWVAQGGWISDL